MKIVNKIPTHVFEWKSNKKDIPLIMVIPGSPGMGHFYIPFARKLFQLGKGSYNVSVVSHAGHSPGHRRVNRDGRDWYSLEDQVEHKLEYVREHVNNNTPILLVGHSIGCYIIMQMLEQLSPDLVQKVLFLFPAIEGLGRSKGGRRLSVISWFRLLILFFVWLTSWIPKPIQTWVVKKYFHNSPRDHIDYTVEAATNLVNPSCVNNCFRMFNQELTVVNNLNTELLGAHIKKISFYYGAKDRWLPPNAYADMRRRYPGKDIVQCDNGYQHAFVLTESNEMAQYVHGKIAKIIRNPSGVKLL